MAGKSWRSCSSKLWYSNILKNITIVLEPPKLGITTDNVHKTVQRSRMCDLAILAHKEKLTLELIRQLHINWVYIFTWNLNFIPCQFSKNMAMIIICHQCKDLTLKTFKCCFFLKFCQSMRIILRVTSNISDRLMIFFWES